jgi:hypothetical protein
MGARENLEPGPVYLNLTPGVSGHVHRLVFWKHKNNNTYLSRPEIPEKYSTPSAGTKCKNIILHIPFALK